jgi:hypothetical protein
MNSAQNVISHKMHYSYNTLSIFVLLCVSGNCIWHTSYCVNNEPAAMQAALRLA